MGHLSQSLAEAQEAVVRGDKGPFVHIFGEPRGASSTAGRRPPVPTRGTTQAAAYDVTAFLPEGGEMSISPLETVKVPTGLYFAIPKDSAMLICSRSGLASRGLMVANGPGILDSDYRGELLVLLTFVTHPNSPPFVIKHGDRIAQLLFVDADSLLRPTIKSVSLLGELPPANSNRIAGTAGGFGSTGR